MLKNIVEHLKEKYRPNAIILHGSRARGKEREHSDWDFIFLYSSPAQQQNGRELYENQNIEFSTHLIPVFDIHEEFSNKLQVAEVVYEEGTIGSDLLKEANIFYQRGVHWSQEQIHDHELWMQGRIDGMQDNIGNEIVFAKYNADFYQRVFNYWYWVIQNLHSQPFYVAVEEVSKQDPEFFELVKNFASAKVSLDEKVKIAEKISSRLFQ